MSFDDVATLLRGEFGDRYATPDAARAMCVDATEESTYRIWEKCNAKEGSEWVELGALNGDDDDVLTQRYTDLQQCSDHFTAYHCESDQVVDFTFRQFDPEADYPLICSKEEWIDRLVKAWETDRIYIALGWIDIHSAIDADDVEERYIPTHVAA